MDKYYKHYSEKSIKNKKFYNVGSGKFKHPFWTNIDHCSEWYSKVQKNNVDIDWDLLDLGPVPLESGEAEIVYSSHTIEHITDEAAQNMFNECYRILKKGGIVRITAPNIDVYHGWYVEGSKRVFNKRVGYKTPVTSKIKPLSEASIQQMFLWQFASNASTLHIDGAVERVDDKKLDEVFGKLARREALNYCISKCSLEKQRKYPGNHINWWNKAKSMNALRLAGFNDVYLSSFGKSRAAVLRDTKKFDNTHSPLSFYIESIK